MKTTLETNFWAYKERFLYHQGILIGQDKIPIGTLTDSSEWKSALKMGSSRIGFSQSISSPKQTVIFEEGLEARVVFGEGTNSLFFRGKPADLFPEVPHVLYNLSERQRNSEGRFTLHAAAIAKDGEGILVLGDKGNGKTALAMNLCLRHGFKLIGNDILVIGQERPDSSLIGIHSGDGVLKPRRTTLTHFPDLSWVTFDQTISPYNAKITLDLEELGILLEKSFVPIVAIVQVFLSATDSVFSLNRPPLLPLRLNLFENASRYIRGITTPILGPTGEIIASTPSFDNEALAKTRTGIIEKMANEIGVQSISGSNLTEMASYVSQILK